MGADDNRGRARVTLGADPLPNLSVLLRYWEFAERGYDPDARRRPQPS